MSLYDDVEREALHSMPKRAIDRFMDKVDITDGCWLWTASCLVSGGYGQFYVGGPQKMVRAHRWSYEHFVGPIPEGLQLDHLCRTPRCVNPAHLEPVTHRENTLRGEGASAINARKTHCVSGHPLSGENLIVRDGARTCRACRDRRNASRARNNNGGLMSCQACGDQFVALRASHKFCSVRCRNASRYLNKEAA